MILTILLLYLLGETMHLMSLLHAVLALSFVIGLLLLTLWAMKYIQVKFAKHDFLKKLKLDERILVLEKKRIDAKNLLLLFKKDNVEFLVLIGSGGVLLLDKKDEPLENDKGESLAHV